VGPPALEYTFGLEHAHHALIDEHAGEAHADGLAHEQRGARRIDAPRVWKFRVGDYRTLYAFNEPEMAGAAHWGGTVAPSTHGR
jgi:hypothetical protein